MCNYGNDIKTTSAAEKNYSNVITAMQNNSESENNSKSKNGSKNKSSSIFMWS